MINQANTRNLKLSQQAQNKYTKYNFYNKDFLWDTSNIDFVTPKKQDNSFNNFFESLESKEEKPPLKVTYYSPTFHSTIF